MNQFFKKMTVAGEKSFTSWFNWLFPHRCLSCHQTEHPEKTFNLCIFCWDQIFRPQRTVFSQKPNCVIYAGGHYEGFLKRALILSKFKHDLMSTEILITLITEMFQKIHRPFDLISFIPSYYRRSLVRGVDLPALLAYELSKSTGIEFRTDILKKRHYRQRQSLLSRNLRQKNTVNLFKAEEMARGKNILIIDDVMTTGSTILSCYRALSRKKPAGVTFLTIAKTRYF